MGFFDTVKENLATTSQGVAQKFSNATETAKLNSQVKSNQRMVEKLLYQVGEKCYSLIGQEENTPYDALFTEIKRLQEQNVELQKQIAILAEEHVCSKCGFKNNGSTKFCINCGAELEGDVEQTQSCAEVNGKTCPQCQTANAQEAIFCVECGTRFTEE